MAAAAVPIDNWDNEWWRHRYSKERLIQEGHFDWYVPWAELKEIVNGIVPPSSNPKILIVGAGNSMLAKDMFTTDYPESYKDVTCIDFAETVVTHMQNELKNEKEPPKAKVGSQEAPRVSRSESHKWFPLDVVAADFEVKLATLNGSNNFDCVIDKACLDAVWCTENCEDAVPKMLHNISKVLAPNGRFICFSHCDRSDCLDNPNLYGWSVLPDKSKAFDNGLMKTFVCTKSAHMRDASDTLNLPPGGPAQMEENHE